MRGDVPRLTSTHLKFSPTYMDRRHFIRVLAALIILAPLSVWANGVDSQVEPVSARLANKGEPLYRHFCAHCHGVHGDGDGYNAENLDKDPAELSDAEFLAKRSNERLFRVVQRGGRAVKKSNLMPSFGQTLSEEEIWSLVAYIRVLAQDFDHPVHIPKNVNTIRPPKRIDDHASLLNFVKWFREKGKDIKSIQAGEILFKNKLSCFGCHQVEEEGGRVGPDLSRAGFLYNAAWLYFWMRNPQLVRPDTKMPNLGVSPEQAGELASYLKSLQGEDSYLPAEWSAYLEKVGDPESGARLFFDVDGAANCAKCHSIKGDPAGVGPDLRFAGSSRTREFLLESILNPRAVITAGYASVLILTKQGKFLTGIKFNEDDGELEIVNKEGEHIHVLKNNIKKFKTQKISIMPGNFKDLLSVQNIRDLLAFLQTLKVPDFPTP